MNTTRHLRRWGNSAGLRLPKKVVDAANWNRNQELDIQLRGNSVVLTPVKSKNEPSLDALLKGVTPAKIGGEFDWGGDIGVENYA